VKGSRPKVFGGKNKAIVPIFAKFNLSLEAFWVVRTAAGIPVTVLVQIFSYRFPGWYWQRAMKGSKTKAGGKKQNSPHGTGYTLFAGSPAARYFF